MHDQINYIFSWIFVFSCHCRWLLLWVHVAIGILAPLFNEGWWWFLWISWKFCEQILWQRKFSSLVYVLQCTIRYQAFKMTERKPHSVTQKVLARKPSALWPTFVWHFSLAKNCVDGTKQIIYILCNMNRSNSIDSWFCLIYFFYSYRLCNVRFSFLCEYLC